MISWPVWTVCEVDVLLGLEAELARVTKKEIAALSSESLATNTDWAGACRVELWSGLRRLRRWMHAARTPESTAGLGWAKRANSLVLLMDGDT